MNSVEAYYKHRKTNFRRCTTNLERVDFFIGQMGTKVPEPSSCYSKNDQKAVELRQEGNARFQERKYFEALDSYSASLAWAQSKEVAAFAFSNRSAVLARIGRYRECLIEIDRAFKSGYPEGSKTKLIKRKSEVLKLQKRQQCKSTNTNETIEETPDCIEILSNDKYGRHIVAKRDIEIGELLLIEQPIASVLTRKEDSFIYCHHCNLLCYNLIPCDSCSKMLFCGKECKERAWKTYHKYVCGNEIFESMEHFFTITLQITISIMKELKASGKSGILEEMQKLAVHTDKRPLKEVFFISYSCYAIFKVLQTRSSIFVDFENMEDTFKELLLLIQEVGRTNGLRISRVESQEEIGYHIVPYAQGLCLKYSAFNHSCFPNAFFYHERTTLYVRALGTIKKGEQCFISYCYVYSSCSKAERQQYLKQNFYFTCDCRACVGNWPSEVSNGAVDPFIREVATAHGRNDQQSIKRLRALFIKKMKLLEQNPPSNELTDLRHLFIISHYSFQNPRNYEI